MRIPLLLFFFCCWWMSSYAQNLQLNGRVINPQETGLSSVKVVLLPSGRTLYTDENGQFSFRDLSPGKYTIQTESLGYHTEAQTIDLRRTNQRVVIVMHTELHQLEEVNVHESSVLQQKANESLNLEVVDKDFIQRHLGGSLMTTLSRLPGIKTIGIGSGQSKPLIRGLGFNRVVVVDKGVKHEGQQWGADHGLELDQFAARQVEIVKGAASFLYGSDAIAGVIHVKPAGAPEANTVGGSVDLIGKTNNGLYGTSVNLFGRKQNWFVDTRFTYQNYGDYRVPTDRVFVYDYAVDLYKNQLRNTAGRENGIHVNTGFVSDHFQTIFYVSNVFNKSGFFANAHGLEPRRVDTEMHDASARDILMPSQEVNHFKIINRSTLQQGNHLWEMELGYQHNFRQEFNHYVNHGYMPPIYPDTMSIPAHLEREYDKQVYSANLRDKIRIGNHDLTVGFNSEHQDNNINGWTFLVPAFKQTTAGVFVYDKYEVNERTILHAAMRYDYSHTKMAEYRDWFESPVTENGTTRQEKLVRAENLTRHFNSFVWSLGMNYNLDKLMFKANAGKSFRVPITKEFGANGINYHYYSYEKGDPNLSPEESYQGDITVGWNDTRWSVQLSPFYNYFPNYIYLNPTPHHIIGAGAGNQLFQYAQSRVMRYGGELHVKYNLLPSLSAEVLGEYLYAEQLSGDKRGFTLPFSPPASALFNMTWSPEVNSRFEQTYVSLDYRVTAAQDNIVPPEKKTAGYQLVNLQLGSQVQLFRQPLQLSLQVQNLLDTRYLNHTSFYRLIELPEMGRNIVLSVKVPFTYNLKTKR